jgi:hypothetical protein
LALAIPSVFIKVFGIIVVGIQLDRGDFAYLLLLFALFIQARAVLFLVKKLRKFCQLKVNMFIIHCNPRPARG